MGWLGSLATVGNEENMGHEESKYEADTRLQPRYRKYIHSIFLINESELGSNSIYELQRGIWASKVHLDYDTLVILVSRKFTITSTSVIP